MQHETKSPSVIFCLCLDFLHQSKYYILIFNVLNNQIINTSTIRENQPQLQLSNFFDLNFSYSSD
jgi:hypothetical protein